MHIRSHYIVRQDVTKLQKDLLSLLLDSGTEGVMFRSTFRLGLTDLAWKNSRPRQTWRRDLPNSQRQLIFSASFLSDFQSDQGLWILGETLQLKDPTDSFHILFLRTFWPLLGGDFSTLKWRRLWCKSHKHTPGFECRTGAVGLFGVK